MIERGEAQREGGQRERRVSCVCQSAQPAECTAAAHHARTHATNRVTRTSPHARARTSIHSDAQKRARATRQARPCAPAKAGGVRARNSDPPRAPYSRAGPRRRRCAGSPIRMQYDTHTAHAAAAACAYRTACVSAAAHAARYAHAHGAARAWAGYLVDDAAAHIT